MENWQGSSKVELEDISGLKAKSVAQNIKIEELELAASVPREKNGQNCGKQVPFCPQGAEQKAF